MQFVEITSGIHVIVGGTFPHCNSLAILDDEVVIVDPGCSIELLRRFLAMHDLELRDVDSVILSHIHPDHITHAVRLHRLSGCRLVANDITAPLFDEKERMKEFLGFIKANPVRGLWEALVNEKMYGALDEGKIDEVIGDGGKFSSGDTTLQFLYTPGHLPDHMCLEILDHNFLFAADIDCTEFGPYYGHPNSSINEFKKSIEKVQQSSYVGIISGHLRNPVLSDYKPALDAYARQFDIREDLVYSAIAAGANTLDKITMNPIIYPSLINPVFIQFEKWMIEHHVSDLKTKALIFEEEGKLRPT